VAEAIGGPEQIALHPRASARAALTRDGVVRSAAALVDQHGVDHLTMRRLGAELGVAAMSLYRYVTSREELLQAIADHLVEELTQDPTLAPAQDKEWKDFLRRWAHGMRRLSLAHPGAFALLLMGRHQASGLRPPLGSPRAAEAFFAGLLAQGFTPEQAAATYRWFTSFLVGQLTWPVSVPVSVPVPVPGSKGADLAGGPHGVASPHPLPEIAAAEVTDGEHVCHFPALQQVQSVVTGDHATADFEAALAGVLERVRRLELAAPAAL